MLVKTVAAILVVTVRADVKMIAAETLITYGT
jgi:hypothetical protein